MHDVSIVTVFEADEYAAGLAEPGSTCFILTNTRSLSEDTAVELNTSVSTSLFTLGQSFGGPMEVISRGDSTLRGHVIAEIQAIDAARRRVTGAGFDGVLLIPSYFEAGRFTAGDIHWANVSGKLTQPGTRNLPRTRRSVTSLPTCGTSSPRRATAPSPPMRCTASPSTTSGWVAPSRVAEILQGVTGGAFVVVNATDYADLEIVVLGLLKVEEHGRSFGTAPGRRSSVR